MKKTLLAALCVIALLGLDSCKNKKKTPVVVTPELSVTPEGAVIFASNGQTATVGGVEMPAVFTVATNMDTWTAVSDQPWLTVKADKDAGTFALSAQPNPSAVDSPTALVTVSVCDTLTVVIPVSQLCVGIEGTEYAPVALVLGRGYDVTGRFAYSPDIKAPVLDFVALYRNKLVKRDRNLRMGKFNTCAGSEASEYTNKLALEAGVSVKGGVEGICSFQSELASRYKSERYTKDSYSFATVFANVVRDAYFIDFYKDPARLRKYVSAAFLEDLAGKPAEQVIALYGTHVMLGGIWGARLDHHFSAKKRVEAYTSAIGTSFSSKAEATINGVTGGAGSFANIESVYRRNYDASTEEKYTNVYGGSPEFGMGIHSTQDYDNWIKSIPGNEIWCNYYPESLVPVYELVEDATLRNNLKTAYDRYLRDKTIVVSSSMKNARMDFPFELKGGSCIGGDSEMDTENNKDTKWRLSVSLSRSGNESSVKARVTLYAEEMKGDHSKIQMTQDVTIPINRPDFVINENPLDWTSGDCSIRGKYHGWVSIDVGRCPFLKNVYIQFDRKGGDDHKEMGVKGTFTFRYSYVE